MLSNKYGFYFLITLFCINIQLFSQVTASFTSDSVAGCAPLIVAFTNTSQNASNFTWDFGNNTTSNLTNPSTTYTSPGFYTVKLIAQNGADFDSIIMVNYIEVFDLPTADFTFSSTNLCENDNLLTFANNSSGASSYFWDFGDGNSSTLLNPTHQFQIANTYNIKLKALNSNCSDLKTVGPITIFPTPIISGFVDTVFSCDSNFNFTFNASSSNVMIDDWSWNFGDGNNINVNSLPALYSYNSSGSFITDLIATSNNGCVDSITIDTIIIPLIDDYSINSSINTGCPPLLVNFDISPSNSIQSANWSFGDTNTFFGNSVASNNYLNPGNYNVSADVIDLSGCAQFVNMPGDISIDIIPTGTYNLTNTTGCPPLDVQFDVVTDPSNTIYWDFGDGTISNISNIVHTYSSNGIYNPKLTLTSPNGCSTVYTLDNIESGLNLTNFSASPTSGCAALEVNFTNSAPSSATSFLWDFGDGNFDTVPNPTHIYDTIGEYTVIFSCSDSSGCTSQYTINKMIETFGEDDVVLPSQDTIFACSPYTFTADAGNIGESYWNWDLGDGNYSSGPNVTHQYTESGIYTVLLNADAPNACMYNIVNYAIINVDNLIIDLDININDDCNVGTISVINNSIGVLDHNWNMGDYNGYTTANVQGHPYNTENSYLATYEALSSTGCIVSRSIPVIFNCDVNGDPIPDPPPIDISPPLDDTVILSLGGPLIDQETNTQLTQTCGPELVSLSSPFSSADVYFWDFGDGHTSNKKDPTHLYNLAGIFDLTHYATDTNNGNIDTLFITAFIDQYILDASFSLSKSELCNEANFQFANSSDSTESWVWSIDSSIISTNSSDNITLPLNDSVKILNLKIEDKYGCIDQKQQSLFLYQPLVIIEQDTFVCTSNNASFNASVVGDPIHSWNLNDGNILGPDTAISHTYSQNGFYEVILSLDNQGCIRDISLDTIEAYGPDASFYPVNPPSICHTDSILFIANDDSFNNNSYEWSGASVLGNGDSTWIQFIDTGKKVISLSIKKRGCRNTIISDTIIVNKATANFTFEQLNGCLPIDVAFQDSSTNPTDWQWDFGDGNFSSFEDPTHQYISMPTDSVNLIITDSNGCHDSIKAIIINELNADFIADDTTICANTPVTFSGLDDVVNNWQWDFGDGNTSTDSVPVHYYQNAGNYEVKLIVSDGQGCNDTVIKTNYIEVQEVIADFSYSSPGTCPPIVTTFTNQSIGATDYIWDFGDGVNNVIVPNPSHIYETSGSYFVTLVAIDNGGCRDTLINPDSLYIPGPQLNFSIDNLTGCDSLSISIIDSSINAIDYYWDFRDGSFSTLINPSHTYNSIGSYNIILSGVDAANCTTYYTSPETINIHPSPLIDLTILDSNICLNSNLLLTNNTNADNHFWTFNSITSSVLSPLFLIDFVGTKTLYYSALNFPGNCSTEYSINIIAHQIPDISIIDQGIICSNQGLVDYNSTNQGVLNSINWYGNGIVDSIQGLLNPIIINDSTMIYATFDSICSSEDSLKIIIENPPNDTILTPNDTLCFGQPIPDPQVLNTGGLWSGINVEPNTGSITDTLFPGSYIYQYKLSNLNCSDSSTYQIEILNQSNATILSPGIVCENQDTAYLSAVDTGGAWSGPFINSTSGLININNLAFGNYEYVYNIYGDCPDTDTFSLEIFEFILAQINDIFDFCEGTDSIQFTASTTIGEWSGLMNTQSNNGWFITDSLEDGTYEVYYTVNNECPNEDTLSITILPRPEIDVIFNQELPCVGYPINVINNSMNLSNENYSWYVNNDTVWTNFNEPYFSLDTGSYQIKTSAINQFLCTTEYVFLDTIRIYDNNPLEKPEIIRSTVENNNSVFTQWKDTSLAMNPLSSNLLFRSINGGTFNFLIDIDSSYHSYLDTDVDVFTNNYKYFVISKNICEINSSNSNIGSSIRLIYEKPSILKTKLEWNKYDNWNDGVNRYEIQKLNSSGQWEIINFTDSSYNRIILDE